jgi:hypothetical protein
MRTRSGLTTSTHKVHTHKHVQHREQEFLNMVYLHTFESDIPRWTIANYPYCIRWGGIFKGLSQDGGRTDFSKNLPRLSLQ